jgi:hypothetical protein
MTRFRRRKTVSFRPCLQSLEDRNLLSTYTVDHLADDLLGRGLSGSLRYCITQAADGDTITFGVEGTITLTQGELAITKSLHIDGPGAGQLAVSGAAASRVLEIADGTKVFLSGLTITGGQLSPTGSNTGMGAGIANHGNLTLAGCAVTQNNIFGSSHSTAEGGGIFNDGTLTVIGGSVADNTALGGSGFGAGIWNGAGTLSVMDGTISSDRAFGLYVGEGGGVFNLSGSTVLTGCTLSGNSANRPSGGGGGVFNASGTAALTDCTITANHGSLGAGVHNEGLLTMTGITLSGNQSGFPGGAGGGPDNEGRGTAELIACTIAGNVITGTGVSGGGISNSGGGVTLTGCTVTGNATSGSTADGGGGLSSDSQGSIRLLNTIVAGNSSGYGAVDVSGPVVSLGRNLVGVIDGSTGWGDSDLTGTADAPLDPMLGSLGNYGGPTPTIPPLAGSPALDVGDSALLGTPDQRGVVRSGGVNIGAYQASASAFVLSAPAKVTAGVPFDLTVTAVDRFGQLAAGYTGTVMFSTTDPDPGVVLPADYAFTAADAGVHTFNDTGLGETTLLTRGYQSIAVTDTADGSIMGSAVVKVRHLRRHGEGSPGLPAGQNLAAADRVFAVLAGEDVMPWSASGERGKGTS